MNNVIIQEITDLIIVASTAAKKPIKNTDFEIKYQGLHHIPIALPKGKIAVYTFVYKNEFLKIGQAGGKSKARYQSHHYHVKSGDSTLANSLLSDQNMQALVSQNTITQWIRDNCERYDVLIASTGNPHKDKEIMNFIEGLLHYRYEPRYEGKK